MQYLKTKFILNWVFSINTLIFLSGCYAYGPTHESYNKTKPLIIPQQVQKVVAPPISKSEYMQKTYNEIKQALPEADVKLIEDSIKVLFPNHITYDKSALYPASNYKTPLIVFSGLLKKYTQTSILITGHTDSKGKKEKNKELSSLRAINIKNFIIEHGIPHYRLNSMGLGDIAPIDNNETENGRARNRRVEFIVMYNS
ncbi:MAG: OmpA family protein [Bacteroidetes bacterium]|nr:OmpA family protein [Bacteroidota bacterium]